MFIVHTAIKQTKKSEPESPLFLSIQLYKVYYTCKARSSVAANAASLIASVNVG
ncbi:hypothetical protein SAMN04487990_11337 [Bizionia paragorgiae]|uniref:Uncharacterized protein n=1 Tax=Bizionia paragorgiae TaxID=283786 RepID=A0A1H4B5M5_BIZPA|nr:hypothetical protein SAMN04487990_11337 [Bizionia paragorgiae]